MAGLELSVRSSDFFRYITIVYSIHPDRLFDCLDSTVRFIRNVYSIVSIHLYENLGSALGVKYASV